MGFQSHVLHPLGPVGVLVDEVRRGETGRHIAELGMQFRDNIPFRPADAGSGRVLVPVDGGGPGEHGALRGEDGLQELVVNLEGQHAGFRRRHGLGDDGGDPLSDEAHHVVEHPGVVRVVGVELVLRGGKQLRRGVLVGEDRFDSGNGQRRRRVDGADPGVGVRGAQQLHVQQPGQFFGRDVQGVAGLSRDDSEAGGCGNVVAQLSGARLRLALPGDPGSRAGGLGVPFPSADGVLDGAVSRAPAQVPLEVAGQVCLLLVVKGGRRHHQAGRAKTTLEALPVQELLLHRVECGAVGGVRPSGGTRGSQSFDRGDGAALRADGGINAAVHRHPVHMHRARAAVAGVAALLHAQVPLLAEERPQALAGAGFGLRRDAVDLDWALISAGMFRPLPSGAQRSRARCSESWCSESWCSGSWCSGACPAAARSHRTRGADRGLPGR